MSDYAFANPTYVFTFHGWQGIGERGTKTKNAPMSWGFTLLELVIH